MECLEIAAARLGTPELAIDIQFAHEDKHYELMQTAAELYLYLSDLHKHSVGRPDPNCPHCKGSGGVPTGYAEYSTCPCVQGAGEQLSNEGEGKSVSADCDCKQEYAKYYIGWICGVCNKALRA